MALLALVLAASRGPAPAPKPAAKPVLAEYDYKRDPATQSHIDPARVPALRQEVTAACLCTRRKGGAAKGDCWRGFWEEVNGYRNGGEAVSACGPGSSSFIEFEPKPKPGEKDGEPFSGAGDDAMLVMTSFGYGACSADEVVAKRAEYERKTNMRGC